LVFKEDTVITHEKNIGKNILKENILEEILKSSL